MSEQTTADQTVGQWVEDIKAGATGRVVLHAELPVSAAEPVLDDEGKELGRLDELVESGRPLILHVSGYTELVTAEQTPGGAPVLHVKPHQGGSLAVNEILAR